MAIDMEQDIAAETVARRSGGQSRGRLVVLAVLCAVGAIGYSLYVQLRPSSRPSNAEESFATARNPHQFGFDEIAKPKPDNRLVMAPPAAPPVIAAPPPILVAPEDADAKRRAEQERQRLAEEERLRKEKEARAAAALRSPMLMVDAQAPAAPGAASDSASGAYKVQGANEDKNRQFLDNEAGNDVERSKASKNNRIDALIPQGTMIRATLETAVQSDLPGMVRAITTEDVYSFDGRRILIPKGAMLTGDYRAILTRGQTRVFIVWTRALRSDGVSLSLGSYGTDALGRSGVTGEVDEHYAERFGAAVVLSIVGGASSYLTGLGQAAQSTTSANGVQTAAEQAQAQSAQTVSQTFADMANSTLKEQMTIPPTINIDQGAPIMVFVRRDLDFSGLYDDPVKVALTQLKHPGRAAVVPALSIPSSIPQPSPLVIHASPASTTR
jgi:type IV secretion system protein VirB10